MYDIEQKVIVFMGITSEEFFQNVYNVMFSPKNFFEDENMNVSTRLAIFVVAVMTAINKFALAIADNSINGLSFIFTLIGSILISVLMWFLSAVFFEYTAKIFDMGGKLVKLLYLTAFASIPMLFFAPLNLLKQAGEFGYILSVILSCILYIWIFVLYAHAVKNTYNITLARAFMFILLPLISSILAIYQIVGFYQKIWYIFSI